MDKVICTVMLIIGGLVASIAVINGLYPAVQRSGDAIVSTSDKLNDRIKTDIEIIQVNVDSTTVDVWIKNIGSSEIITVENSDVFFGPTDDFSRIPYDADGSPTPCWDYELEGSASQWGPTNTMKITLSLSSSPSSDTYFLKVIIPNGIADETFFGVD